jgi:hypothetical protein
VALPLGALLDPLLEEGHLPRRELLARLRGRHLVVLVRGGDPLPELAAVQVPRRDRGATFVEHREDAVAGVEPEVRLARLGVRPVALVAVLGEDGTDVAVELDDVRQGDLSSRRASSRPPGSSTTRPRRRKTV